MRVDMNIADFIQRTPVVPYIREGGYAVRKAYYFPPRRLLDYLLIHVRKGPLIVNADGRELVLEDGDFCLLQPGTAHDLRADSDNETPFVHMDFFYNPLRERSFPTRPGQLDLSPYLDLMQPRLNDLEGIRVPLRFHPSQPMVLRSQLLKLIDCWLSSDPIRLLEAQAVATQLVHALIEDHRTDSQLQPASERLFRWVPSYFSFRLAEPLTLKEMADRAHLSVSRFRDVFKKEFGMPPHQYLIHLRIEHAKELLVHTDYSLMQIAEFCGFSNVNHFCHTFRKRTGRTAASYRKKPVE